MLKFIPILWKNVGTTESTHMQKKMTYFRWPYNHVIVTMTSKYNLDIFIIDLYLILIFSLI